MEKIVPHRQVLISLLEDLLRKYPPASLPSVIHPSLCKISDNTYEAFKEIIGEYPELLLFPLFVRIYSPQKTATQIADEILSPKVLKQKKKQDRDREQRSRERGLSLSNKILLDADRIINQPDELIKRYGCTIDEIKYHSLIRIAYRRLEAGKSVDQFFIKHDYSDDVKELIARSLHVIQEVGIMFRTELYKSYADKSKTVKKMPEADAYYRYAQKLNVPIVRKQVKKDTILRNAKEYRTAIMGKTSGSNRDRHFYDAKRFRYLTVLVVEMDSFFKEEGKEPRKALSSPKVKGKDTNCFSIDGYLDEKMNIKRNIYGVLFLPDLKELIRKE